MKLIQILKENYSISKVEVLLKSNPQVSKTEIINKIRAVPYVIIVRLNEDPRLVAQSTEQYEYTMLSLKFLNVFGALSDALNKIKNIILEGEKGMHKIDGVMEFRPLMSTLEGRKRKYIMSLFRRRRDINLFKSMNRELLHNIIKQQIGYYKFKLDETKVNFYGEAKDKTLIGPVLIYCLINRGDAQWDTSDKNSPDLKKTNKFKFLKDDLVDANVVPEVGDVILWNEQYFEVDSINENQLIVGKDPDYAYSNSVQNHGSSLSIIVEAHYSNPERGELNLKDYEIN